MIKRILLVMLLAISVLYSQERTGSSGRSNDNSFNMPTGGIAVTIGGSFIVNGSFQASPLERVDQFVTKMFVQFKVQSVINLNDKRSIDQANIESGNYARRNILLKRTGSQDMVLDLEKFRLTGDFKYNPYLKNDDVLIFPKVDIDRDFISIDGAVSNPVKFQFVRGDKLADAMLFAQGISPAYQNVRQAEITRLSYNGQKDETILTDINSDLMLQPGDRIRILADETNRKDYRVLVLGEVNRPGYIPIAKENVTVKDVVEKAGGFKKSADLFNAELIRATDSYSLYKKDMLTKSFEQNKLSNERTENNLYDNRTMEELMMSRMSNLKEPEDTMYFKVDNELRLIRANGLVDFTELSSDTSISSGFLVKDGDVILVPEKRDLVYVFGQVARAGYVKYIPDADINYYIGQAGGLGELARDMDEINIIKGKSRSWYSVGSRNTKIEPGDYIWVPKETPRTFTYYFDKYMLRIGQVASIVGTIVTIILLTKK